MQLKEKAEFIGTLSTGIFFIITVFLKGMTQNLVFGAILIGISTYRFARAKDKASELAKGKRSGTILQKS